MDYQLIGLFVTIAFGGGGVIWRLTRVELNIRSSITEETDVLESKIVALSDRIGAIERQQLVDLDIARREAGEGIAAIRTKVHEIETWARDEFVRKGSFELIVARMEKAVESLGEKIDKRLDRLSERMEKASGG